MICLFCLAICNATLLQSILGWRPSIAFLYLFLFHSLLRLTSFLSQNQISGLATLNRLSISLPLSFSSSPYFLSFSKPKSISNTQHDVEYVLATYCLGWFGEGAKSRKSEGEFSIFRCFFFCFFFIFKAVAFLVHEHDWVCEKGREDYWSWDDWRCDKKGLYFVCVCVCACVFQVNPNENDKFCALRKFFCWMRCVKSWSERRLDDADFIFHFSYFICLGWCHLRCYSTILNTHYNVECVLAKQPRLFWRGSDEPQVGRWVFSCWSISKFSNFIFYQKAIVFLVHEKGEKERERGFKIFLFLICSSESTVAQDQLEEFFQVHHCILSQVCEWWAKCE